MIAPLRLLAHAKVNLSLQILGRRPDGFHALRTLIVPLTLADRLMLAPGGPGLTLACPGHPELETPDNLVLRAAAGFRERFGLPGRRGGLALRLEKRIPIAAGLGGGSSDAGAVLRGLARLQGIRRAALLPLAADLGSDVPFFLTEQPAVAEGRGERVSAAPNLPRLHLLLVKPSFGIAAGDAYRSWAGNASANVPTLTHNDPNGTSTADWLSAWRRAKSSRAVGKLLQNDLQPGCLRLRPELADVLSRLGQLGADGVLMSGSGSTCFAVFGGAEAAAAAGKRFAARAGEQMWLARSLGVRGAN